MDEDTIKLLFISNTPLIFSVSSFLLLKNKVGFFPGLVKGVAIFTIALYAYYFFAIIVFSSSAGLLMFLFLGFIIPSSFSLLVSIVLYFISKDKSNSKSILNTNATGAVNQN